MTTNTLRWNPFIRFGEVEKAFSLMKDKLLLLKTLMEFDTTTMMICDDGDDDDKHDNSNDDDNNDDDDDDDDNKTITVKKKIDKHPSKKIPKKRETKKNETKKNFMIRRYYHKKLPKKIPNSATSDSIDKKNLVDELLKLIKIPEQFVKESRQITEELLMTCRRCYLSEMKTIRTVPQNATIANSSIYQMEDIHFDDDDDDDDDAEDDDDDNDNPSTTTKITTTTATTDISDNHDKMNVFQM